MRRPLRWFHEFGGDVLVVSLFVAVVLTVIWSTRPNAPLSMEIGQTRDLVDLTGKAVTMVLGIGAAIATYRRFFKGRLLNVRLRLRLSSKAVRWIESRPIETKGAPRTLLHAVDLEIENVGAAVLFDPQVVLKVRALDSNEDVALDLTNEGVEEPRSIGALEGIGPGEVVVYHYRFRVLNMFPAFRISTEILGADGSAWARSITVANLISPSDSERTSSPPP